MGWGTILPLKRPYEVLIIGIKAPYPFPPQGPYDKGLLQFRGDWPDVDGEGEEDRPPANSESSLTRRREGLGFGFRVWG